MDSPVTPDGLDEGPIHNRGTGTFAIVAVLVCQVLQDVKQVSWLDAAGAAHCTEIAGEAMPHGAAGQDFVTHPRPYHGNNLARGVFHHVTHGATTGTDTTLDAGKNMFTTGGGGNFLNKGRHLRLYVTTKPLLRQHSNPFSANPLPLVLILC